MEIVVLLKVLWHWKNLSRNMKSSNLRLISLTSRDKMKRIFFTLALLVLPTVVYGQTTNTFKWDYPNATLADLKAGNQVVRVDNTVVTTPAPVCVAVAGNVECELTLTGIPNGSHVFRVSVTVDGVERSSQITKTFPISGGLTPGNLRFTITIIIGGF